MTLLGQAVHRAHQGLVHLEYPLDQVSQETQWPQLALLGLLLPPALDLQ